MLNQKRPSKSDIKVTAFSNQERRVKDPIKEYATNYQLSKQLHALNHSSELGKNAPVSGVKPPSTTTGMSNRLKMGVVGEGGGPRWGS
jgi:hypothetical protein